MRSLLAVFFFIIIFVVTDIKKPSKQESEHINIWETLTHVNFIVFLVTSYSLKILINLVYLTLKSLQYHLFIKNFY